MDSLEMKTAKTEEETPVWAPGLRIVQLDLARKMETPEFIKGYIDRVAAAGHDTLQLYLEARVATRTTVNLTP